MSFHSILDLFQGVSTLFAVNPGMAVARISLIFLGILLVYLGKKGTLEPLLMIPMGLGMSTINAAVMFFDPLNLHGGLGTLFVESGAGATANTVRNAADLMSILQIDFLQPIYTFTFSNGLIACLVFMGIGSLLDVGFVMIHPFIVCFWHSCRIGPFVLPRAQCFGSRQSRGAIAMIVARRA